MFPFNDKFVLVSSSLVSIKEYLIKPASVISIENLFALFNRSTFLVYNVKIGTR